MTSSGEAWPLSFSVTDWWSRDRRASQSSGCEAAWSSGQGPGNLRSRAVTPPATAESRARAGRAGGAQKHWNRRLASLAANFRPAVACGSQVRWRATGGCAGRVRVGGGAVTRIFRPGLESQTRILEAGQRIRGNSDFGVEKKTGGPNLTNWWAEQI